MPDQLFAQIRALLTWEQFTGFAILLLSLLMGAAVEFCVGKKRQRLLAAGKLQNPAQQALFAFGRVPDETIVLLSGLRILFLIVFWGCSAGLVVINITGGEGAAEYLFPAGASVVAFGFTLLFNSAVRSFREAGIFFLEERLIFSRFTKREVPYREIQQAISSEPISLRFNFLRIPVVSGGIVKLPVADLRADRPAYSKLRSFLEERHGIRFPAL